ncbi:MAG TPA: group II intron maturase-specific domain-containing protein [Pyrinomonadaceae bacterium]|jgi:hypothetical protein
MQLTRLRYAIVVGVLPQPQGRKGGVPAGYYSRTEWLAPLRELDGWVRRRLRRYVWRAWQKPRRRYRILRRHGIEPRQAWRAVHLGPWRG